MNVSKRFVNNKIFCHKAKKISNDNEQINVSDEKLIELLSKEDFKRIDDLYEKTYKNYRIAYDQSTKSIFIFNNDKTKYEQIRYKLKDNFIIYEYLDNNKNINSYIYSIEDESTFNSNNFLKFCLDYITYITENI